MKGHLQEFLDEYLEKSLYNMFNTWKNSRRNSKKKIRKSAVGISRIISVRIPGGVIGLIPVAIPYRWWDHQDDFFFRNA